jgi:uncharacterized membrane protein YhaH (DUF805 family)
MNMKELYLGFSGRINRKKYILAMLPLMAVAFAAMAIDEATGNTALRIGAMHYGIFQLLSLVILLWPGLALGIKRLHDRNRPGWMIILGYVPLINIWIAVELLFIRGTAGTNRFGADPLHGEGVRPVIQTEAV